MSVLETGSMSIDELRSLVMDMSDDIEDTKRLVTEMHTMMVTVRNGISEAAESGGMAGMLARSIVPMPMVHGR